MELQKISNKIFYYPHQPETDRPMLAYLNGEKIVLAIDAGNSADHVDEFYQALKDQKLKKPDLTVITHWHWDHTFGMYHIHGLSIASDKTNWFLNQERAKLSDNSNVKCLKDSNVFFGREYGDNKKNVIVPSDIQFGQELTLNLGGMTAIFFHVESPHSEDTVLIYIPEEEVLFLGDSTSEDFYNDGYMDRGKLNTLINVIENTECQYCIVSHTEPLKKSDLLQYLKSI
jgi:glyoxylase-like metal-dependent hydrolase (beta-lactamase superfamily II)